MYQNIIKKINLLIEMSNSTNTYETLCEELEVLTKEISSSQKKWNDAQTLKNDSKYIKASDRLIDENIKISLENKVKKYQNQMELCVEEIEQVSKEEEEYHEIIEKIKGELESLTRFLNSLELKTKTVGAKDKSSYEFYQSLIEETSKEIEDLNDRLKAKQEAYDIVKKRLESYGTERVELESKIKREQEKLDETTDFLANLDNYVDIKMKQEDEKRNEQLSKDIEALERRKLEIITDPVYIGHEAIEFVKEDDVTSALEKVKELVTILETMPYMNYHSDELEGLLEEAKAKRDEFENLIEGKDYNTHNKSFITNRIDYLQDKLHKKEIKREQLEAVIREIDIDVVKELMKHITELHKTKDELQCNIENYKQVIKLNEDFKTPRRKAKLKAAWNEKNEELRFLETLLNRYEQELEKTVMESKDLEENNLMHLHDEIQQIEFEIKELNKMTETTDNVQDILAIERDKTELKNLSDNVEIIIARQQYQKTPMEIFDEIEFALKSKEEPVKEVAEKKDDFVDLSDYRIEKSSSNIDELEDIPIDDEQLPIPEPMIVEPLNQMEDFEEEKEEPEEEFLFPPRSQNIEIEPQNSWKVIKVEPLEEKNDAVEALNEEPFMVNDFEDTGYISFNDLLEGKDDEN